MRVFAIVLFIFLSYSCSFGFMVSDDNFQKEIRVLKELDIDPKYINDEHFLRLKNVRMDMTKKELKRQSFFQEIAVRSRWKGIVAINRIRSRRLRLAESLAEDCLRILRA